MDMSKERERSLERVKSNKQVSHVPAPLRKDISLNQVYYVTR